MLTAIVSILAHLREGPALSLQHGGADHADTQPGGDDRTSSTGDDVAAGIVARSDETTNMPFIRHSRGSGGAASCNTRVMLFARSLNLGTAEYNHTFLF